MLKSVVMAYHFIGPDGPDTVAIATIVKSLSTGKTTYQGHQAE